MEISPKFLIIQKQRILKNKGTKNNTIDNLIDSIVILSSKNRQADAEKLRNELYEIVGNNNEHINKEIESRIEMNNK